MIGVRLSILPSAHWSKFHTTCHGSWQNLIMGVGSVFSLNDCSTMFFGEMELKVIAGATNAMWYRLLEIKMRGNAACLVLPFCYRADESEKTYSISAKLLKQSHFPNGSAGLLCNILYGMPVWGLSVSPQLLLF